MSNTYSAEWFETFMGSIPAAATGAEVAFIERQVPVAEFPHLLDLCCGRGRHAAALTRLGHRVHGVDIDEDAIRQARAACPSGSFEVGDMRRLQSPAEPFDGVLVMWQSFGHFDDATNFEVIRRIAGVLRPGGRALFDMHNRDHVLTLPEEERGERGGRRYWTRRLRNGPRHRVTVEYEGGGRDEFEWRLFSPQEFSDLARQAGFEVLLACARFDEKLSPAVDHGRMQFVLQAP